MANHPNRGHRVLQTRAYIAAMLSENKRHYASEYQKFLRGAAVEPEPFGLSAHDAETVRARLREIWQ